MLYDPDILRSGGSVRFTCRNCSRGYSIPDARVRAAGESGLRIRCKSCRAIMAVDIGTADATSEEAKPTRITAEGPPKQLASVADPSDDADVTANDLPNLRRREKAFAGELGASMSGPVPEAPSEESMATPVVTRNLRADKVTKDAAPRMRKPAMQNLAAASSFGGAMPAMTDIHAAFELPAGLPATMSASGIYRPLPGVDRRVQGVPLDPRRSDTRQRWYAAIDGEPRGPFSEDELLRMAHDGRVRGRTLVWRPGFDGWTRIRSSRGERDDLEWLRRVVIERKRAELAAADRARRDMGIHAIRLDDRDAGTSYPPQLPVDAAELSLVDAALDPSMPIAGARRHRVLAATFAGALLGALLVVVLFYTLPALLR